MLILKTNSDSPIFLHQQPMSTHPLLQQESHIWHDTSAFLGYLAKKMKDKNNIFLKQVNITFAFEDVTANSAFCIRLHISLWSINN